MKLCPKCFTENYDDTKFCENCGQDLSRVPIQDVKEDIYDKCMNVVIKICDAISNVFGVPSKTAKVLSDEKTISSHQEKIGISGDNYINPDETTQALIGVSYVQSYMSGAGFKNGAAILTDERLYYFGKSYSTIGKGMSSSTEEAVISVEDITLTRFVHSNSVGKLVIAISLFVLCCMFFSTAFGSSNNMGVIMGTAGFLCFLLGILSLVSYVLGRGTVLEIAFPGGKYCLDSRWHSKSNMREFQRHIHLVKDNLKAMQNNVGKKDVEVLK